tara:strand:- start:278 stop:952 length:675 start_codon:yes stop_codon:yes gene_type:complete
MCGPVAAATAVLGGLQAHTSYRSAKTQARSSAAYKEQLAISNAKRYNDLVDYQDKLAEHAESIYNQTAVGMSRDLNTQYSTMIERANQFRDQAIDRVARINDASNRDQASVRALSSYRETAGNTVRLLRQQYARAEAQQTSTIFKNLESELRQGQRQLNAYYAQAQTRLNRALPGPMAPIDPVSPLAPTAMPSSFPYLLQGTSTALSGYATQRTLDSMTPPSTD